MLNPKLSYDPVNDVASISLVGVSPYVLVAHPGVPAHDVAELIALAKAKPRTLSYSSVGEASLAHLAGLQFSAMAGVELNHIPYKSSTQAVIDLNEGRIDLQFGILPTSLQFIRAGKLRALAVTTEKRLEELPDVPTLGESGLAGFEATLWLAVIAPKGMSPAVVARLNRDIGAVVSEPDVRQAWLIQGHLSRRQHTRGPARADCARHREMARARVQGRDAGQLTVSRGISLHETRQAGGAAPQPRMQR